MVEDVRSAQRSTMLPPDSPLRDGLVSELRFDEASGPSWPAGRYPSGAHRALRAELGVPDSWPLESVRYDLSVFHPKLSGCRLVVHGTLITQGADDAAVTLLEDGAALLRLSGGAVLHMPPGTEALSHTCSVYEEEGYGVVTFGPAPAEVGRRGGMLGGYMLLQLSARIRYGGSPVYAERRWHPGVGRWDQIGGLEHSKVPADVTKALTLFPALDRLDSLRTGRGKHDGDGATWAGGLPDFLDDLWTTLEKLTAETSKPYSHDPVSRQFRSKMREATPSVNTMRAWLKKADLLPKHIKGGNVNRANYLEFVGK